MAIVRWDPFCELASLQSSITKLFDESFKFPRLSGQGGFAHGWTFPVDVKETEDSIILKADIPGLNREEIKINFAGNQLTILGERKKEIKEEGERFLRAERSFGSFSRTFTVDLPVKSEEIKARYVDGILEIALPKKEDVKPRQIEVEAQE